MLISPDCGCVPDSDVTAGATDALSETISIPPEHAHISGAGVAGAIDPYRETVTIQSDCERVSSTHGDAGNPFFVWFYVEDGILVEVRFFQDWCRLRRVMASLALDNFRLLALSGPQDPS